MFGDIIKEVFLMGADALMPSDPIRPPRQAKKQCEDCKKGNRDFDNSALQENENSPYSDISLVDMEKITMHSHDSKKIEYKLDGWSTTGKEHEAPKALNARYPDGKKCLSCAGFGFVIKDGEQYWCECMEGLDSDKTFAVHDKRTMEAFNYTEKLKGRNRTDFKNCPNPDGCYCDGTCKRPIRRDDRFWEQQRRHAEMKESTPTLEGLLKSISALENEINCRIEHGADSNGHLEYVLQKLKEIK